MPFKINYMVSTSAAFFLRYYPFSQMYSNFTTDKMGGGGGGWNLRLVLHLQGTPQDKT